MTILNKPETALPIQMGLYKINEVIRPKETTMFPVALVSHKKDVSYTAVTDLFFYVQLEKLYTPGSTSDGPLWPGDLQKKIIHVKALIDITAIGTDSNLKIDVATDWEVVDTFKLYNLYKQQGEDLLVSPPEEQQAFDEAFFQRQLLLNEQQEIDEANLQQQIALDEANQLAEQQSIDDDIEFNNNFDYSED